MERNACDVRHVDNKLLVDRTRQISGSIVPAGAQRHQLRQAVASLGQGAWLVLTACATGAPLAWIVVASLSDGNDVFDASGLDLTLANYRRVWMQLSLGRHLLNSAAVAGVTISVVLVTSTLAGYAFARLDTPGLHIVFYFFLAAMMVPSHAILVPMFIFLREIDLLNNLWGLSLSLVGGGIAFSTFVLRAFFRTIPSDFGDAARLDGCGEFRVFRLIYLPLARSGMAAVAIMQFVFIWNELLFSTTFITDEGAKTLQPAVFQAVGRYAIDYPALSAGLVVALLPVIVAYFSLQRHMLRGLGMTTTTSSRGGLAAK